MEQQPPPAVNGAPPSAPPPVQRKKKPVGASSLFKPTNNRKTPVAISKPAARPLNTQNGVAHPNLNNVAAFPRGQNQQTVPTINAGPIKEYKLVTSKRELVEGLRHHLLQLNEELKIDVRKESDFTKPGRLHRRNPDWKSSHREPTEDPDAPKDADTETLNKRREARQKQREENMAQIAPSMNTNRRKLFTKKTAQAYHNDYTEDEKRRIQMNYEEKVPWVLEDFDNKYNLVGKHNQGSMNVYAALAKEQTADGERFRLLPVEKHYRFDKHSTVQDNVTWDQFDQQLRKNKKLADMLPDTIARKEQEREMSAQRDRDIKRYRGLYVPNESVQKTREGEDQDLDFEDDFADDEEGDMFGDKDDEEKAAEKKVKEDHLRANIGWQEKDEQEVEANELKEDYEEKMRERWASGMRKTLEKREKNFNLGSDSDSAVSSDSEAEKEPLEADKLAAQQAANTLKRPRSPNASDATSGTEASSIRNKKQKKSHRGASQQPTPSGSRPMSPDGTRRGGPGSDTDGGAMSDGTRLKLKLKRRGGGSANNSPPASRAGSPGPGRPKNLDTEPFPTAAEIQTRVPVEGLLVKDFLAIYKAPSDPARRAEWQAYIKKLLRTAKDEKQQSRVYLRSAVPMMAE